MKGLKLPCPMRWLSWASAFQMCPDELRRSPLIVRSAQETFGTTSDTRASSCGAKFQLVKTTAGDSDYSSTSVGVRSRSRKN